MTNPRQTLQIIILQDGTYDLLEECRVLELSDADYMAWAERGGDIDDLVVDVTKAGRKTETVTVNKASLRR